jgi:hypothetical protein
VDILRQIRLFFWERRFSHEQAGVVRMKQMTGIDEATSIGILFDASQQADYDRVCEFIKNLQDRNKTVRAIGFVNAKAIPHYCIPKLSFDFFTLRDINWYYKPTKQFVSDFLNHGFNLCINLDLHDNLSLQYISGLSRAGLKVGVQGEKNTRYYDLLIQMDDRDDLEDFITQIVHYLSVMKPPNLMFIR